MSDIVFELVLKDAFNELVMAQLSIGHNNDIKADDPIKHSNKSPSHLFDLKSVYYSTILLIYKAPIVYFINEFVL